MRLGINSFQSTSTLSKARISWHAFLARILILCVWGSVLMGRSPQAQVIALSDKGCETEVTSEFLKNNFQGEAYRSVRFQCLDRAGYEIVGLRSFHMAGREYLFTVNSETLQTKVQASECLRDCFIPHKFSNSLYSHILSRATDSPFPMVDDGVRHELNFRKSIYLTADLCPSSKPMDTEFFEKIQGGVKPVPVALSISGKWLLNHYTDFKTLLDYEKKKLIKITWVNHTYSHPYHPKLPNAHNFLLMSGVDLEYEVLENEKLLLSYGLVPSIFFRFPGLISDQNEIFRLRQWGLIPLAADAWLALGQKPGIGSIILVHANGNEPRGLKDLYFDMERWPAMKTMFDDIHDAFINVKQNENPNKLPSSKH